MESLNSLIDRYGIPDILIDHFNIQSKRYSVWGYEEEVMVKSDKIFLNNKPLESNNILETLQEIIDRWKKSSLFPEVSCVGFISYNFKNLLYSHIEFKNYKDDSFPQLWFCKPKLIKEYSIDYCNVDADCALSLLQDIPDLSS